MTREEAIQILNETQVVYFAPNGKKKVQEALDMAISALSAEQNYVHIETYRDLYEKYIELKHKSAEPIKVITDDTIEVRYTDFENIKRIILTNGDIFCKIFYEDTEEEDDEEYINDIPDEYMTEPSDLISRADAIEAVRESCGGVAHCLTDILANMTVYKKVKTKLESLPSADESIVRCKDCKWYECAGLPCPLDLCESLGDDGFCSRGERREE